jgi:hypothetical protein
MMTLNIRARLSENNHVSTSVLPEMNAILSHESDLTFQCTALSWQQCLKTYLFQYLYTGELAGGSVLMKMLQVNACPLPSDVLIFFLIDDTVAFE